MLERKLNNTKHLTPIPPVPTTVATIPTTPQIVPAV